jgi:hypothetical protein
MRSRIMFMSFVALLISSNGALAQSDAASSSAQTAPTNEAPPTPEHTGWATLVKDTAHDFVAFPQRKSTWTLVRCQCGSCAHVQQHPRRCCCPRCVVPHSHPLIWSTTGTF